MNKKMKKMILTSIFAAMSILLYLFPKFPLPIFPSFLEINFSMLPIVICGFSVGTKEGGLCALLRYLVKIIIVGSSTCYVGETMDFLLGGSVVIITSLAYHFLKAKEPKKSILSLVICALAWVVMGSLLNVFYSIPLYLKLFFNGNVHGLVKMMSVVPGINESNYMFRYVVFACIPFNLILAIVVCSATFFVNKAIYIFYDENVKEENTEIVEENEVLDPSSTNTALEEKKA